MATRVSQPFSQSLRFFIGFASIGLSIYFLNIAAYYVNTFFLALLIVLVTTPIMYWLEDKGVPKGLASMVGLIVAITATVFISGVIALSVVRTINMLPAYAAQFDQAFATIEQFLSQFDTNVKELTEMIQPEQLISVASAVLNAVLSSVSILFMTILIAIFMMVESFVFPAKIDRQLALGNPQFLTTYRFTKNIRQYVRITTIVGIVGGAVIAAILFFFKIEYAVMWGALYFIMNYVPLVGFWFALLPVALLAWLELGPLPAVIIVLIYMILSSLINQVIKPAFMREGLDLSPLWSIMSLVLWSAILGPPGLIIGVPLTIALKELVLENDEDSRWVSEMISAGVRTDPPPLEDTIAEGAE